MVIITDAQVDAIQRWREGNGGFVTVPKADALKVLEEVVELCIASGASLIDLEQVITTETAKAHTRGELGITDLQKVNEEFGDSMVTLVSMAQKWIATPSEEVQRVIDKINARSWSPDETGILRRPRT